MKSTLQKKTIPVISNIVSNNSMQCRNIKFSATFRKNTVSTIAIQLLMCETEATFLVDHLVLRSQLLTSLGDPIEMIEWRWQCQPPRL